MQAITEVPTAQRRAIPVGGELRGDAYATASRRGALVAVCGLAGGAGATTLAYLIAVAAARQSAGPVLVADGGGPSGALAMLAGVEAPRSLPVLAYQLEAGLSIPGGVSATGPAGVRVLASGPEFEAVSIGEQLTCLLLDAREAHALTVLDCGTLSRDVELTMARAATHVVWVTAATAHGLAYARRVLAAAPSLAGKQIIVGRADARQAKASLRELRRIATDRHAPLVLVPHLPGLEDRKPDKALEAAQVPLQAILGALTR